MTEIRTTAEAQEEAALPRAKVVHTASDAPQTAEVRPLPPELTREPPEDNSPAPDRLPAGPRARRGGEGAEDKAATGGVTGAQGSARFSDRETAQ